MGSTACPHIRMVFRPALAAVAIWSRSSCKSEAQSHMSPPGCTEIFRMALRDYDAIHAWTLLQLSLKVRACAKA